MELESGHGKSRPASARLAWAALVIGLIACNLPALPGLPGIPAEAEPLPRGTNPILATLTRPTDRERHPVGAALQVTGEALAARPVALLELWGDGELIGQHDFTGQERSFVRGSWTWGVPSLGEHLLFVRAIDASGRSAESQVIRIEGIPDPGSRLLLELSGGETLQALAAEYGLSASAIAAANPDLPELPHLDENAPLPGGGQIFIPLPAIPPVAEAPPPDSVAPPASVAGAPPLFSLPPAATLPAAPGLSLVIAGCTAQLFLEDRSPDEAGFFVYQIGPGSSTFTRLATLGPHDGPEAVAYPVETGGGRHQFYAAAFNAAGEAGSNPVSFDVPPDRCRAAEPGPQIRGDLLVLPQPVDLAFVYYSVEGRPWDRLPGDPHLYFQPSADSVALGGALRGENVDLEVWGWQGGSLVYLGALHSAALVGGRAALPDAAGASALVGCPDASCSGDTGYLRWSPEITLRILRATDFRWNAPQGVDGGLWQVASEAFSPGCSLAPAGLLLSGLTDSAGGPTEFTIDLGPLAPEPVEPSRQGPPERLAAHGPVIPGLPDLEDGSVLEMNASPGLVVPLPPRPRAGLGAQEVPNLVLPPDLLLDRYFVRVIPVAGGQPLCRPSTTVVVIHDPAPPPDLGLAAPDYSRYVQQYDVRLIKYSHPVFPDPNRWGCIRVISVDRDLGPVTFAWSDLVGTDVCPASFKGGSEESLFDVIADAWDFIVGLYDRLSDLLKDVIARFNPVCLSATWAADAVESGEARTTIEDACRAAASIAVEAAKAYVGIPPSLPEWDLLDDLGKDYLVELAADEFTAQTGIYCGDECKDLLRGGVDAAHETLSGGGSATACVSEEEAHQHGREPLCPPPGVKFRAAHGAEYIPPVAWLEITRRPDAPDPEPFPSCTTSVRMSVEYRFPGGLVWGPYSPGARPSKHFAPQTVTVVPFAGIEVEIPRLGQGQQVTVAVPFNRHLPVVFPWTAEMYRRSQIAPDTAGDDFIYAVLDGTTTLDAATYWPEYEAIRRQNVGAVNLSCAPPSRLVVTPVP